LLARSQVDEFEIIQGEYLPVGIVPLGKVLISHTSCSLISADLYYLLAEIFHTVDEFLSKGSSAGIWL